MTRYVEITMDLDRITRNTDVMGRKPCVRGMRVTAGMIVGLVASGRTHAEMHGRTCTTALK